MEPHKPAERSIPAAGSDLPEAAGKGLKLPSGSQQTVGSVELKRTVLMPVPVQ